MLNIIWKLKPEVGKGRPWLTYAQTHSNDGARWLDSTYHQITSPLNSDGNGNEFRPLVCNLHCRLLSLLVASQSIGTTFSNGTWSKQRTSSTNPKSNRWASMRFNPFIQGTMRTLDCSWTTRRSNCPCIPGMYLATLLGETRIGHICRCGKACRSKPCVGKPGQLSTWEKSSTMEKSKLHWVESSMDPRAQGVSLSMLSFFGLFGCNMSATTTSWNSSGTWSTCLLTFKDDHIWTIELSWHESSGIEE